MDKKELELPIDQNFLQSISSVLEQASVDNVKIMALKILDDDGSCGIYSEIAAYKYIYDAQVWGSM